MSEIILLAHGNGGLSTKKLIEETILKYLGDRAQVNLYDAHVMDLNGRYAFSTDSFVISPIFFNGGDIGELAAHGTCNDLGVMGAKPLYLSLSFIIEEGFKLSDFEKVVKSIRKAAEENDVIIVTGDTKVVEKGKGDGIFINTTGVGIITEKRDWRKRRIEKGDLVLVSGTMGDHGTSIMLKRLGIETTEEVKSDVAPIGLLGIDLLERFSGIKFMRDPTRGGLATVLNEVAEMYSVGIEIDEEKIPVKNWVKEATEILGVEPYYIANEGKIVIIADKNEAEDILSYMKNHPLGKDAAIIGEVIEGKRVYLRTKIGTRRILDFLKKDLLPRIC